MNLINWGVAFDEVKGMDVGEKTIRTNELMKGAIKYDKFECIKTNEEITLFPIEFNDAKIKIIREGNLFEVKTDFLWNKIEKLYEEEKA